MRSLISAACVFSLSIAAVGCGGIEEGIPEDAPKVGAAPVAEAPPIKPPTGAAASSGLEGADAHRKEARRK